jgi:CRP-like cAMP-binding protein
MDDDRELLSSYGEFFPGHPGSVILEEGAQQTDVFVVISGVLEVHGTDEEGNRVLRARVGPGETLGEISLFDRGPATATVTASKFCQLWRIADEDLIQFMEDNPGAGNVLLRTLATILAQRLRQVDPAAFGLSAYAVVESPELEEQDAAQAEEAAATISPVSIPETATPGAVRRALTPVAPGLGTAGKQPVAALLHHTTPTRGKSPAETQIIPDPDELEPL